MLYHISPRAGLTLLQPRISSHGAAYVYAVDNLATGLLFGAKKDDFDLLIDQDRQGRPEVWECYPDAFRQVYQGRSCWVYQVEEAGFLRGKTGWDPELVCPRPVPVAAAFPVEDLCRRLLEEQASGGLILHRYDHGADYRRLIAGHVADRALRFDLDLSAAMESDPRFAGHYRRLAQGLLAVLDGHLLD